MRLIVEGISDIGQKRTVNQDAIFIHCEETRQLGLFAVADGMGGHIGGEKASRAITEGLKEWVDCFSLGDYDDDFTRMLRSLQNKLLQINGQVHKTYGRKEVCGSTCVLLFIFREQYGILYAGDSRIYLHAGGKLKQLTRDDVWENQQEIKECYSKTEVLRHPDYGKLIKAVGATDELVLTVKTDRLRGGESFLLCSDGLYKYCEERILKKVMRKLEENRMRQSVERLLEEVYRRGAGDNVSLILVQCRK